MENISRRSLIKSASATGIVSSLPFFGSNAQATKSSSPFKICLNTSTIMKQNIGLIKEIEYAAKAGFEGIEVWMRTIEAFQKEGGKLSDIKKRASDLGISIENVIGFAEWMSDDENKRKQALEQTKREMDMLQQIGCTRIAAPPFGAITDKISLEDSTARYKALMDVGDTMAVQPQLEIWGFSKNIHLVGQSVYMAAESGHTNPAILADVYHLHKGGSAKNALNKIDGSMLNIFHMNDYPAEPGRDNIKDSHRVMPGDGVAPMKDIMRTLAKKGKQISISLELFSEKYWAMKPQEVLAEGFDKMKKSASLIFE
ncbi:MAG: sugar phosphate isomerase/epimerase family protein [Leadbetterella sp.]